MGQAHRALHRAGPCPCSGGWAPRVSRSPRSGSAFRLTQSSILAPSQPLRQVYAVISVLAQLTWLVYAVGTVLARGAPLATRPSFTSPAWPPGVRGVWAGSSPTFSPPRSGPTPQGVHRIPWHFALGCTMLELPWVLSASQPSPCCPSGRLVSWPGRPVPRPAAK